MGRRLPTSSEGAWLGAARHVHGENFPSSRPRAPTRVASAEASMASATVYPSDRYRPRAKFFRSTLRLIRWMPASTADAMNSPSPAVARRMLHELSATALRLPSSTCDHGGEIPGWLGVDSGWCGSSG
jgi:hypothetical protein